MSRLCRLSLSLILSLPGAVAFGASPGKPEPPRALDAAALDTATKACDDFYQFANGGWIKVNPIPADRARWGSFEELADRNRQILKSILEEASARSDWPDGSIRQKVGDFFASGMDTAAIEKAGTAPLAPWFGKIDGMKSLDQLPTLLADLHRNGLGGGLRFYVGQDQKESTRYIPMLGQGGLGLPDRDYYLKEDDKSKEIRTKYVAHVARMFELVGEKPEAARSRAEAVVDFETGLAKASRTRVELRDPNKNYNRRKLAELEKEAPGFSWKLFLGTLGVPEDHDLNVRQPEFMTAFATLAKTAPIETWKTYLRWMVVHESAPYLTKALDDENFSFFMTTLNGVPQQEDRWKRVLAATDDGIGEALGQLYVEKAFSASSKARMKTLVENLRSALKDRIESLPWMGAETKKAAIAKLNAFGVKIGYPDKWRDYTPLKIRRGSFFDNVLGAAAFEFRRDIAHLGKPIDRTEWGMSPPTVNAYYSPTMNEIVFPAGILQPPFFYADADDAVNYGGIGAVIGHEMTHGFDDSGSEYDANGNLKNWWTEQDRKAYQSRTDLMVRQFDGYKALPDQAINGKLTVGENIADLGGIKIAYAALAKALGTDPARAAAVDGRTPAQRFFLSWATIWRNNIREDALRVRLNTDSHSPGRYRVLGPLANLPEFATAFGCDGTCGMARPAADRPSIW
jgi:putative endopeptidase